MRAIVPVVLVALLAACGTTDPATPDGLSFATRGEKFELGGPMPITLVNGSDTEVGYNFCQRYWEQRVNGSWVRFEELILCTPSFAPLAAGATAEEQLGVPYGLTPGTWRIATSVLLDGDSRTLVSNEFEIEAGLAR